LQSARYLQSRLSPLTAALTKESPAALKYALWLLGFIFYPILAFGDARYGGGRPQPAAYAAGAYAATPYAATSDQSAPYAPAPPYGQSGVASGPTGAPWSVSMMSTPPMPTRFIASKSAVMPSLVIFPFSQNQ